MSDDYGTRLERYRELVRAGAQPGEIYARAGEDGLKVPDRIKALRELFGLTLQEAVAVRRQAEGEPPPPRYQVDPIHSGSDLRQVLKDELGFCPCGDADQAVVLLRDVLRFARERYSGSMDDAARVAATRAVFEQLGYERSPGLADWFLHFLERQDLVWHGFRISDFSITDKGRWLLDGLERFDPFEGAPRTDSEPADSDG